MTVAIASASMPLSNNGFGGYTVRQSFFDIVILAGGDSIQLTLVAGAQGADVVAASLCKRIAENVYTDITPVTFDTGSPTKSVGAGAIFPTDVIPFPHSDTDDIGVLWHFGTNGSMARTGVAENDKYEFFFKQGVNEAAQGTPSSGYTKGTSDRTFIVSAESFGAPPVEEPPPEPEVIAFPVVRSRLVAPPSVDCLAGTHPGTLPPFTPFDLWSNTNKDVWRHSDILLEDGGSIIVLGDSSIRCHAVNPYWSPFAQNYGINGDTIAGLLHRLASTQTNKNGQQEESYRALHNCAAVVVMLGINDIADESPDMTQIKADAMKVLNWLSGRLVWIAITPTTNATWNTRIADFNSYIAGQLANRPNCQIVNVNDQLTDPVTGLLRDDCRLDLEHASTKGKRIMTGGATVAFSNLGIG